MKFVYIEDEFTDTSENLLEEVDKLLNEGKIAEASETLNLILYPDRYYDYYEMSVRFMKAGHRADLNIYKKQKTHIRLCRK